MTLVLYKRKMAEMPAFVEHLGKNNENILTVASADEFHGLLQTNPQAFETIIADEEHLADVKDFIKTYPVLNYGLISKKSAADFHDMTEGYGFLLQLSSPPQKADAENLLDRLRSLAALGVTGTGGERK
jgi:hypothetical protein